MIQNSHIETFAKDITHMGVTEADNSMSFYLTLSRTFSIILYNIPLSLSQ